MTNTNNALSSSPGRPGFFARFATGEERGGISLRQFCSVALQLGAVLLVIWQFQIEASYGLLQLVPLLFVGFLVHSVIPLEFRLPGFLILSLAAIVVVLGPLHGALLIGAGMALIGVCHLPIRFWARVVIILAVMALCAALRAGWISTPMETVSTIVVPVLAAMFMFRLAIYMYDLRFEKNPGTVWESLSYFFLLPNVCFLLFPVVDYKTFRRTYYDKPAYDIYQKGLLWMMRGVMHLLVYRAVYYHYTISPSDVTGLGTAIHYMISTYMLYLHISGQFHLIIGILCLFGFNLPETHHLFYLASGFNDYWRRINIYWKDFMMKMFYYPVLMRARVLGITTGIVIGTLAVFFGTWLLHAYQWFWLRGDFLLTVTDASFWGILGLLVVVNSVIETKFRSKKKRLNNSAWDLRSATIHSLKVIAMLVTITVLWTLWHSHSVGDFVNIFKVAAADELGNWMLFLAAMAALVAVGVLIQYLRHRGVVFTETGNAPSPGRAAINTGVTSLLLIVLAGGFPFYIKFNESTENFILSLSTERLNKVDRDQMEAGYYEGLLDMGGYTSALARINGRKPSDWVVLRESELIRWRDDIIDYELAPSASGKLKQTTFETNSWGMRDQHYDLAREPGVMRMALLGASYNMGSGVEHAQVFEAVLEDMLNENPPTGDFDRFEILNFSVGGYSVLHQAAIIEPKVARFSPDVALLTVHTTEPTRLRLHLQSLVMGGKDIPYPEVREALARSGVHPEMDRNEAISLMDPLATELEEWSLHQVAAKLRAAGIRPVAVYIPITIEHEGVNIARRDRLKEICLEAGFEFLEMENPFVTDDIQSLQLAEWDTHTNVEGHRRIARNLYQLMLQNPGAFMAEGSADTPSIR